MNKTNYLKILQHKLQEKGYNDDYTMLCVSYSEKLLNSNLPVIFDINHLCLLIGIKKQDLLKLVCADYCYYSRVVIQKKNGGKRELNIPSADLKYIQRWILDNILCKMHVSDYSTGFCNNRSILDNAKRHTGKQCVLNIDLKDFFPSINFDRIFMIFKYYGYTKEVSFILAKLCTYKNELPQGSPASPNLSNICCLSLDARLSAIAIKNNADYSRYADDITLSGSRNILGLLAITRRIINEEGFTINEKKTRTAFSHQRQEVTGLIVNNEKVRVSKKYKRTLYQELYYCEKYGVDDHMKRTKCNKAFFKEHLYGKAFFVNMVEPDEGKKLFKLLERIDWDY